MSRPSSDNVIVQLRAERCPGGGNAIESEKEWRVLVSCLQECHGAGNGIWCPVIDSVRVVSGYGMVVISPRRVWKAVLLSGYQRPVFFWFLEKVVGHQEVARRGFEADPARGPTLVFMTLPGCLGAVCDSGESVGPGRRVQSHPDPLAVHPK